MLMVALVVIAWTIYTLRRRNLRLRRVSLGLTLLTLVLTCGPLWEAFGSTAAYSIAGIFGVLEQLITGRTDVFNREMALVYGRFFGLITAWVTLLVLAIVTGVSLGRGSGQAGDGLRPVNSFSTLSGFMLCERARQNVM